MLLGIYDDLLLGGGRVAAAAALTGKLYFAGMPATPNTPGNILVTPDLLTWSTIATPIRGYANSVAVGNELMIAVGNDFGASYAGNPYTYAAAVSTNGGATWTSKLTALNGPDTWGRGGFLAFGKGVFVNAGVDASGYVTLWSTQDGVNWTKRASPFVGSVQALNYVNGYFFLCGYDTVNRKPVYAVSADGASFVRGFDIFTGTVSGISRATYVNGVYVLEASPNGAAEIAFSTDLANWTRSPLPWAGVANDGYTVVSVNVVYFGGQYWATGSKLSPFSGNTGPGLWASSPDLKTWTVRTPSGNAGPTGKLFAFAGKLVASYTLPAPAQQNLYPGAGFVYPVATTFALMQSSDGASFSPVNVPLSLYSLAFAGIL